MLTEPTMKKIDTYGFFFFVFSNKNGYKALKMRLVLGKNAIYKFKQGNEG